MSSKRYSVALFGDRWNAGFERPARQRVMLVAPAPWEQTASVPSQCARVMSHGALTVILEGVETVGGRRSDACKPYEGLGGLRPTSLERG